MGIEYLSGIKPGDVLDLSRFEKKPKPRFFDKADKPLNREQEINPDVYMGHLQVGLRQLAQEVNKSFPGFLSNDGKIAIAGPEAAADLDLVASQEDGFSRDFHGNKPANMQAWREENEKKAPNLTEIALTLMLNNFLNKEFIVARASSFDDYNNGVDNILIDKKTGEVLCGFDEVMTKSGEVSSAKKEAKLNNLMAKGGARLKYGARLENGNLVRAAVKNIPAFYLPLDKQELKELLDSFINSETNQKISEKIFLKLIKSLEEQVNNQDLNSDLQNKTRLALVKLQLVAKSFTTKTESL